jgi:phosphoheptose isomerase
MPTLDFARIKTYPLAQRRNLVHWDDLVQPGAALPDFSDPELDEVLEHIIAARHAGKAVIWSMGAHVIKCGLSPLLVDLMERGLITHVAGNGAVSIHDFELCLIGETSEDVPHGLEDGSFGMAEETSALMHQALRLGVRDGLGYGASLGRFIAENPERFPFRQVGVLYNAYRLGIPATIHATIGTDIIHQHPSADFAVLGAASGQDFRIFTASVSELEGGVYLNFGSAVTGPEVFLKALTIVRNLGCPVFHITTANFDLRPLPEYRAPVKDTEPDYYYRPRKNIINRPTSLGGKGYHIAADHQVTIPLLHQRTVAALGSIPTLPAESQPTQRDPVLEALLAQSPALEPVIPALQQAFTAIHTCFKAGGTLFLAGNGGSMSDALHISGELLKSFAIARPLPTHLVQKLAAQPDGDLLARNLQTGMRAIVLGVNPALSSAVANDMPDRDVNLAQELLALAKPGDVFLGISTSGNARNVGLAAQTARALGLTTIALTGQSGGKLAGLADVAIRVPAQATARVQELHILCYHALCEMLENAWITQQ